MLSTVETFVQCFHQVARGPRPERFVLAIHRAIYIITAQSDGREVCCEEEYLRSYYGSLVHGLKPVLASILYELHPCLRPILEVVLKPCEIWVEVPFGYQLVLPTEEGVILVQADGRRIPRNCKTFPSGERVYNHLAKHGNMMVDHEPVFELTSPRVTEAPLKLARHRAPRDTLKTIPTSSSSI